MAKKAQINDAAFSPVKSGLVHAVVSHSVNGSASADMHYGSAPAVPTHHREGSVHRRPVNEVGQIGDRLTREKRVLISANEDNAMNAFVNRMSSSGAYSLKLSHLLRACLVVLRHSEKELIERLRNAPTLTRPGNDKPSALSKFEHRLAREVAAAIRAAPSMR